MQTTSEPTAKSSTRYLPTIARILMGLMFFVFGLNGFLHFIPQPKTPMPDGVMALMGGFMKSGYMMPLIFGTQTLVGALLLLNRFVPLALAMITPVIVNIIAFHVLIDDPKHLLNPMLDIIIVCALYLLWDARKKFSGLLN